MARSPADNKDRSPRTTLEGQSQARWTIAVPGLAGVAALGLSIATRKKLFPALRGWRRWTTSACVGASLAEMGLVADSSLRDSTGFKHLRAKGTTIQGKGTTLLQELCRSGRDKISSQALQKAPMGPVAHDDDSQPNSRADPNNLAATSSENVQDLPSELQSIHIITINAKDGPHTLVSEPGTSELKPQPETNYEWNPRKGMEVSELDNHICQLQTYRAKLAREAQVLWQWLADKEGQYYRLKDSDTAVGYDTERAKEHLLAYVKTLSSEHVKLWIALSKIDWVIADSRKRIEQHQQRMNSHYDNTSRTDSVASSLDFVLGRLQQRLEHTCKEIEGHEEIISVLEKARNDPTLRDLPEPFRIKLIKLKGDPNRDQVLRQLIAEGKDQKKEAILQHAALEDILRDAEKNATKAAERR